MNYEDMSDFEINKLVAKCFYKHQTDPDHYKFYKLSDGNGSTVQVNAYKMWPKDFDYCNNPSDAWPIIVENKIGVMHNWNKEGYWSAISPKSGSDYDCNGRNPLRAAMICFLKMKDAEK